MKKSKWLFGALCALLAVPLAACGTGAGSSMMADSSMGMDSGGSSTSMMEDGSMGMEDMSGSSMMPGGSRGMAPEDGNKGEAAPDFEMEDLEGNTVKLSDFAGQKVYLEYWASWCPICLEGLASINTLSAEENDFVVLTIVAPGQSGEKDMEGFKTWFAGVENTENITVLFDTDGAYGKQAGVRGYPTSAYIGSDGVLVKQAPGFADIDTIKSIFEGIL